MTYNKNKLSQLCASVLLVGGLATYIAPAVAATAAGTLIKNLATVTYEDVNGNTYSAQSNEAVITVKQVYSAEVTSDATKTASAGQMVYVQHTLTNTGNGPDTYTLNVADDNSIETASGINASNIKIYLDSNGNGLADAGEQLIPNNGTITLAAGKSAELVVAVAVPSGVTEGSQLGVKLNVTAASTTTVTDTSSTPLSNADGLDNTNQTLITISDQAVLNYTKSAVYKPADAAIAGDLPKIVYTLTLTNTGKTAATNVDIVDALPDQTTFVSATASGLLTSNGDTLPAAATLSEATIGADLNKDGDTLDTALAGIKATDVSIAPGQTVSVTFTVSYDPATFNNNSVPGSAGDVVRNTGWVTADLNGDGTPDAPIPSNPTQTTLPQIFDLDTTDTGVAGEDDDSTVNNTQLVDSAPAGSTVEFLVDVTNTGSGPDTLELAVANGTFPAGTTFTIWNSDGTVQLVDTNSEAGPDTGVLQAGETRQVMVKAILPTGYTANPLGYEATLKATSSADPSVTPATDTTYLHLNSIASPGADLKDAASGVTTVGVNNDDLGATPYDINDGTNPGTRATFDATIGSTINVPFYVDNDSGAADSFQFSVGSSWDGSSLGALPTGWTVKFYKGDGSGNPVGSALNGTELLPGGAYDRQYVAVVQLPTDAAFALANYIADNNGDGTADILDANGDGDGDQPLFIRMVSNNTGASDIMLDAIDVASFRDISLTPPGTNQIQPGGSVSYDHTLDNTGNTTETVELASSDSLAPSNWNNNVQVDTNGDGVPDKTLSQLVPGVDTISGVDASGAPVTVPVTDADGDGLPEVTLPAGVSITLTPTVYSPSDAAPGTSDTLTITATSTDTLSPDAPSATVQDVTSILGLGQVRLQKTVARDQNCDGTPDTPFAVSLSATTSAVAPGECAIWRIVAENQGTSDAKNVIVRDSVTAYTTYVPSSLKYSLGNGAPLAALTDAAGDDTGVYSTSAVAFYVGTGATASAGGTLQPGEIATVQFSVKVD